MNVPSMALRFRYIWSELGELEELNYSVEYGLPVYNSSRLLKNCNTYLKQFKMTKDRFVTHEELGVERRLSSLEGSFIQHQRYFAALSVMILAAFIGIFSMFFALMSEISEVKSEVSGLKVTVGEVKVDVRELKEEVSEVKEEVSDLKDNVVNLDGRVSNIETYLRLNGTAPPSLSYNSSSSTEKEN